MERQLGNAISFHLHKFSECLCWKDRPPSTAIFHEAGGLTDQLQGHYPEARFIAISAEVLAMCFFS